MEPEWLRIIFVTLGKSAEGHHIRMLGEGQQNVLGAILEGGNYLMEGASIFFQGL